MGEVLNPPGVHAGIIRSGLELRDVGLVGLNGRLHPGEASLQILHVGFGVGQVAARLNHLGLVNGRVELRQNLAGPYPRIKVCKNVLDRPGDIRPDRHGGQRVDRPRGLNHGGDVAALDLGRQVLNLPGARPHHHADREQDSEPDCEERDQPLVLLIVCSNRHSWYQSFLVCVRPAGLHLG